LEPDVHSAIAYILSHGSVPERARLKYLLYEEQPSQEVLDHLFLGQRDDGGWGPLWANDYSSLDATCFRLAQAEQLGMDLRALPIARAIGFLKRRQFSDGRWEEDLSVSSLAPVWVKPGNLAATLYLTANCGFWLGFFDSETPEAHRACMYLKAHLTDKGDLPTYLHSHWLTAGLWVLMKRRNESQGLLAHLAKRIHDLHVSNLAWLAITLRLAGLPENHPLLSKAISLLVGQQGEDGRWPSEDGTTFDVHSTLEALRALQLCGRSGRPLPDAG